MASWIKEDYDNDSCCEPALLALRALGRLRQQETAGCDKCPFPFCIMNEARTFNKAAQDCLVAGMDKLNMTAQQISSQLGMNIRTVHRARRKEAEKPDMGICYWCLLDKVKENVFCRPNYCSMVYSDNKVVVVLAEHRKANNQEESLVNGLASFLFPDGGLVKLNGTVHEHWTVSNVSVKEANVVLEKTEFLSAFAPEIR